VEEVKSTPNPLSSAGRGSVYATAQSGDRNARRADRHPARRNEPPWFTLIEMLVAVGMVALMGVVCWRGLAFIANQRAAIERETTELAQLVRGLRANGKRSCATPARYRGARARDDARAALAVSIGSGPGGSAELEILRTVATA